VIRPLLLEAVAGGFLRKIYEDKQVKGFIEQWQETSKPSEDTNAGKFGTEASSLWYPAFDPDNILRYLYHNVISH
jgi:hypothetical protein